MDSREHETAEDVIKWLKRLNCNVLSRKLDIGDYVLPGNVGVERKRAMDFISSIVDGRLFEQGKELVRAFDKAYVIVEGDVWRALNRRDVHKHSVLGALVMLINIGMRILYTPDEEGTAYILKALAEGNENKSIKPIPTKKGETIKDFQINFLSSLPGIGPRRAEALLRAFGTPLNALNNLNQWVRSVDGINEGLVNMVRRVLTRKYNEEENDKSMTIDEALRTSANENLNKSNNKENKINRSIIDFLSDKQ